MEFSSLLYGNSCSFAKAAMQAAHFEPPGVETLGDESHIFPSGLPDPPPLNSSSEKEEKQELKIHCTREHEKKDDDVEGNEEEEKEEEVEDDDEDNAYCWGSYGGRRPARKFPPAIPFLARTGNLSARMPWVLKRTYKDDGSLVIQEVRLTHHEYFRVRRANGRLTLQLMQMDYSSPLFSSWPKQQTEEKTSMEEQNEKERTVVVHPKTKKSSSSLPSLFSGEEQGLEEENESMNTEAEGQEIQCKADMGEVDGPSTPRCTMSSLMESTFTGITTGCFPKEFPEEGSTPIDQMPVSRMRVVET